MKHWHARVEAVLIATDPATFVTQRVAAIDLDFGGILGDRHYGLTRRAGAREPMYPRGTKIRNRRQLSAVSVEDCQLIAERLGLEQVLPEWLGANLLLSGLPAFTQLPAGDRLLIANGVGLVCEGENDPCKHPGRVIQTHYPTPRGLTQKFVQVAQGLRGIVCSVERPGKICPGDLVQVLSDQTASARLVKDQSLVVTVRGNQQYVH